MAAVDTAIRVAAGTTVVALAVIAASISYSHMHELASHHGEAGWRGHAFPLSVDGIEIVSSLVLLAHQRARTRAGWLPWVALIAGTAASLAANVAVGAVDLVGRAVAGWPAVALLVAIKLISGLLTGETAGGPVHALRATGRGAGRSPTVPAQTSAPGPSVRSGTSVVPPGSRRDASGDHLLLAAARSVERDLRSAGRGVTRRSLAEGLRSRGYRIRNDRLGPLLQALGPVPSAVRIRQDTGNSRD
jgi:Protein of unknown function (DUF2637)